ncbi:MAG: hypothetical protein CMH30_09240 [Micavibrio sp.]|nr:hypothetical protein [Micavibrio sp.]|tara:strand:+ start:3331 stop:4194 length:864 start_codon:yes stop_codon:yes gene_type:complete
MIKRASGYNLEDSVDTFLEDVSQVLLRYIPSEKAKTRAFSMFRNAVANKNIANIAMLLILNEAELLEVSSKAGAHSSAPFWTLLAINDVLMQNDLRIGTLSPLRDLFEFPARQGVKLSGNYSSVSGFPYPQEVNEFILWAQKVQYKQRGHSNLSHLIDSLDSADRLADGTALNFSIILKQDFRNELSDKGFSQEAVDLIEYALGLKVRTLAYSWHPTWLEKSPSIANPYLEIRLGDESPADAQKFLARKYIENKRIVQHLSYSLPNILGDVITRSMPRTTQHKLILT